MRFGRRMEPMRGMSMNDDVSAILLAHGARMDETGHDIRADVSRESWVPVMTQLASAGVELSDLTALDRGEAVELVAWMLLSPNEQISVRTSCPDPDPLADTLSGVFPIAEWAEREIFDLFGVTFVGHPDLTRILLPDSATIFPLRKSFELRESTW